MQDILLARLIVAFIKGLILRKCFRWLFWKHNQLTRANHSDLSERLNLSRDEGEKWIVNLIRDTRMGADARIDLEKVSWLCIVSYRSENADVFPF